MLARYVTMQCHELLECFFPLFRSVTSATAEFIVTAKLIQTVCFPDFSIFHFYLIIFISNLYIKKV